MTAIPPEAITAAARVIFDELTQHRDVRAELVLEAAAPLIAAAERDRILQLARQLGQIDGDDMLSSAELVAAALGLVVP